MSNRVLVVAGETGVGKDYLIDASNVSPRQINRANWGDIFSTIVGQHKDTLGHNGLFLPGEDRTEAVQKMVCEQVVSLEPVVVTSHPVKIIEGIEYVNWDIETELDPKTYIFVTAPPDVIVERVHKRNMMGARQSPELTVEATHVTQQRKLELIHELADYVGSELLVIENIEENTTNNITIISEAIESLRE